MKIYLNYRERIAGFFLLATMSLIILFVVGAAIENQWFVPTKRYHVFVERGEGLRIGSQVLLAGVQVGDVESLTIMSDNRIDVALSIYEEHGARITGATRAVVQRTMGIGEKRILLTTPPTNVKQSILDPEADIPVREPKDLLEVVSSVDLGRYLDTLDRTMGSVEVILTKLEEDNRMVRMIEAFDELGPTLQNVNLLITDLREPLTELISDPSVRTTFQGASKVFNEPEVRPMIRNMSKSFNPEKVNGLIDRTDKLIATLDKMLAPNGHVQGSFKGVDKLTNDGRLDRMMASMERMTDEEKIGRLLDNMTTLSQQMAKIGPEIPEMADEMTATMRELSIVLKALQRSWLLDEETQDVLKDMKKKKKEKSAP